jgi:dephospho-CoA kinase
MAVSEVVGRKEIIENLLACFGPAVEVVPGVVNRPWLRDFVLGEPVQRKKLEAILHPPVLAALEAGRERARRSGTNLFLAEVPLHYEIGLTVSADFVIVVASSRSVQVRRMMETRGLDEQTVHKFLEAQWPIEAKVERADAVIWNDGSLASLEAQVLTLASPLLLA